MPIMLTNEYQRELIRLKLMEPIVDNKHGYYVEDLSEGMTSSYEKTVTAMDIEAFAQITGDTNPVHLDETYAKTKDCQ